MSDERVQRTDCVDKEHVVLVHDWLVSLRGGEKVLEAFMELFPEAPIYTLFYDPEAMPSHFQSRRIVCLKWLQILRPIRRFLLPFLPLFMWLLSRKAGQSEVKKVDLVVSTSSCVAKGFISPYGAPHICYLHSPMRYIWDQHHHYFRKWRRVRFLNWIYMKMAECLRHWDVETSKRVDHFLVNSHFVGERVKKYYNRDFTVLAPPVDIERFRLVKGKEKRKAFLIAGAMVPYKRADLGLEACENLGLELIVMGSGPDFENLRAKSRRNDTTRFIESPDEGTWLQFLQEARALIYPGVEDFGIVPIEALSCGTPVIALKAGGALDYVKHEFNGIFFEEQTVSSLEHALRVFLAKEAALVNQQSEFSREVSSYRKEVFQSKFIQELKRLTKG